MISDRSYSFLKVVKDYADVADFAIIYIAEAHAIDRLPTLNKNKKEIKHHRNIVKCFWIVSMC